MGRGCGPTRQQMAVLLRYMAQEMFAVCSLAFIRRTAMLEDLRSNSGLVSNACPLVVPESKESVKKLLRGTWPNWLWWLEKPEYADSVRGEWEYGVMQEEVSRGSMQEVTTEPLAAFPAHRLF